MKLKPENLIPPIFFIVVVVFVTFVFWSAGKIEDKERQQCIDRGGFPLHKGSRTYSYYCFKKNPLLEEVK